MQILALQPAKRMHRRCVADPKDPAHEWIGTEIILDIAPESVGTVVRFGHRRWPEASDFRRYCGLKRATYLLSLKSLLETGKGTPWPRDLDI
jgi:hypothetical protein